ncbi:MAG TPA: TetR/AcrR family transcriptional regulator [Candidatus Acidoferrales bacterium]|nr:TetR/AcrR family transcriptional regulator [Candidatus Acidoferrales bacterium]
MKAAVIEIGSRDKILDAAEDLFSRRGFAGIGMREVAEAAGLGKSSLFHHFPSKAELYAAVVGRILDLFDQRTMEALAAGGDVLSRFDRWLDTLMDTLAAHRNSARLLLRSLFEDDDLTGASAEEQHVDDTIKHLFGAVSNLLQEGMQAGVFRRMSIPHVLQSLVGLTVYHFASGEFGEEMFGQSLFTPQLVRNRKQEVKALLHDGLMARRAQLTRRSKGGES